LGLQEMESVKRVKCSGFERKFEGLERVKWEFKERTGSGSRWAERADVRGEQGKEGKGIKTV